MTIFGLKRVKGWTLTELAIALGVLALIATFTIPKVLSDYQQAQYYTVIREDMTTISTAVITAVQDGSMSLSSYKNFPVINKLNCSPRGKTGAGASMPVYTMTTTAIDNNTNDTICYLPNGSTVQFWSHNAGLRIHIDADGPRGANSIGVDSIQVSLSRSVDGFNHRLGGKVTCIINCGFPFKFVIPTGWPAYDTESYDMYLKAFSNQS
jgi:Tfp pilus assembly protein FimT